MLARVEWAIKDIERRVWLSRNVIWWCILPSFVGILIPVFIFGAIEYAKKPELLIPLTLLLCLGVVAAVFYLFYIVTNYSMRFTFEQENKELRQLRALCDGLLNTDE